MYLALWNCNVQMQNVKCNRISFTVTVTIFYRLGYKLQNVQFTIWVIGLSKRKYMYMYKIVPKLYIPQAG